MTPGANTILPSLLIQEPHGTFPHRRRIWGPTGVLGDSIWRTGNAATQLRTSAPMLIGGRELTQRVEQFTVVLEPTGDRAGMLRLRWDTMELSAPIALR